MFEMFEMSDCLERALCIASHDESLGQCMQDARVGRRDVRGEKQQHQATLATTTLDIEVAQHVQQISGITVHVIGHVSLSFASSA